MCAVVSARVFVVETVWVLCQMGCWAPAVPTFVRQVPRSDEVSGTQPLHGGPDRGPAVTGRRRGCWCSSLTVKHV